jgi:glutaredoxin
VRPTVTVYSRTICGLCDRARETILAARSDLDFSYQEVFVDGDPDLEGEYGLRVPVVLVDGEEAFEIEVDPAALRRTLRGAGAGSL